MTSSEEKLKDLQTEARHLKASLKKHENLLEKYKKKVESATTFLRLFSVVFLSRTKNVSSIAGPAAPPGLGGKLPEAGGVTERGAGGEGEPREGEGAGEAGASVLRPRAGDADRKTEEVRATAAGRGAGGSGAREAQHGAQCCPR